MRVHVLWLACVCTCLIVWSHDWLCMYVCVFCVHTCTDTTQVAVLTGAIGIPCFLVVWYFSAVQPLLTEDDDDADHEDDARNRKQVSQSGRLARYKAKIFFFYGRISELPIFAKFFAPLSDMMQALFLNVAKWWVKNDPKNYVKIIVSFYQVSASFASNIDVSWPDTVMAVWKFFAFLTMELFKLYGYDCMFGGLDYLQRLILVTVTPISVVFIFSLPWLASFFVYSHRRAKVFDRFCNVSMWIVYLIYPLLCLMTIRGFSCIKVDNVHLLAADLHEPCPWDAQHRNSSMIFVWSVISTILYPIGIPVLLLSSLIYLQVPRLARAGQAEAIFQQMLDLYIRLRDKTVSARIAAYVGGQKADANCVAEVKRRAIALFSELSCNGEYEVSSTRMLEWLGTIGISGDGQEEELDELFVEFDEDRNGILDQDEMLKLWCVCVCARARACVRPCVRACVRACSDPYS